MADVKGYVPPTGEDAIYGVPYQWMEGQEAHRISGTIIHSPESAIITGDEDAQRRLEQWGLEELSESEVEGHLAQLHDDQEDEEDSELDESDGDTDDVDEEPTPEIPADLSELDYRGDDDDDASDSLQDLAQAYDIDASQSRDELEDALAGVRDGGSA